ncbi:MAG TPA: outer membrane beta-barrel protein, partial [Saprospiraceae bacterium]|nr:outer membrane beta-barrel protein [Saprospiraceae bacterium]
MNSDIQLDSTSQVQFSSRLGFGDGSADKYADLQNLVLGSPENESKTTTNDTRDNLSLNSTLTYMKRLGNRGRNFSLSGTINKNDDDTKSNLDALTEYFTTGDDEALRQLQKTNSNDWRTDGQFSYTEPLRKRRFLEINYLYSRLNSDYVKNVNDITDTSSILNPSLSTDYNSVFEYHRPGFTLRYSGEVHNINLGLNYQISDLIGHIDQGENEIKRHYTHFMPRFIWRWDIGNGKNLRFSYVTRVSQPSITQLSPVADNSDPLRIYVGNPNLDAEYSHNLSLNFHSFSQFSMTSFFVSMNGALTENKIITSRSTDNQFVETSTPINIDHENRMSLYANFGHPFKLIHSRFSINANMTYTNTQNYVNTELLDLNRWSRTGGITFSNLNSKTLEYNFGGDWTFTDSYYKTNDALNQSTVLSHYFVDATLTLWKKWRIQGNYDYNLYSSDQFAQDQSLPLLGFSISRFLLPMDKLQLKFSVFDVLDENRGLSRTSDINYIEEIRSNSIGRYAMISAIYNIRG